MNLIYLGAFGRQEETWYDASPINHVAPGKSIPPFLIVYAGERIESKEISSNFALKLRLSECQFVCTMPRIKITPVEYRSGLPRMI
jgi:hypothetical protein